MYAIVKYNDCIMEKYKIIYTHNNITIINEKLHELRKLNKDENIFYRIVKM